MDWMTLCLNNFNFEMLVCLLECLKLSYRQCDVVAVIILLDHGDVMILWEKGESEEMKALDKTKRKVGPTLLLQVGEEGDINYFPTSNLLVRVLTFYSHKL
jgi:hypothetical protein